MNNNSRFRFFISPLIVLLFLSIIFIINDVYPLGKNTIINGDLGKAYVPIYYYMFDIFKGNANIFMNFDVGMGSNMYDLFSIYGILSPINLILNFTSRSNIPYFLSYLLIIKICLISITSFILFDKVYRNVELFWKVLFSVFYALGIYIIVYHTNLVWLDNIILFPILLLGFKNVVDSNNFHLYTIVLCLSFCLSFYISYMEILFILFLSFLYLKFFCPKENKKKFIFSLGIGTFLALGMSILFVGPVVLQTFNSARFNYSTGFYLVNFTIDKVLIVCGYGFPIALFVIMLSSKIIDSKFKKFFLYLFLILCIGVILDPINKMWHTGSYKMFPFRYGFIPVMIIYMGGLYYLTKNPTLKFKFNVKFWILILLLVILAILFYFFIPISIASNPSIGIMNYIQARLVYFIVVISFVLGLFVVCLDNFILKKIFICLIFFVYYIGFGLGYIGITSDKLYRDDSAMSVFDSEEVYDFLKDDNNGINRYKFLNNYLMGNYAFISNSSSISTWKMIDFSSYRLAYKLGYYANDSIIEDGGTLFSDNILGINKYISRDKLNSNIFDLIKYNNKFYLYKLNNYLGYGFLYDNLGDDNIKFSNSIDFNNKIYKKFFNKNDNILEKVNYVEKNIDSDKNICVKKSGEINFSIVVDKLSELYFDYGKISNNGEIKYIKVNGVKLKNSNVYNLNNKHFNDYDGIIDLGTYNNEVVDIDIYLDKNVCIYDYQFATLSIDKLNSLINDNKSDIVIKEQGNSFIINVDNKKNKDKLFLPLNYLNGYVCKLNGENVSVDKVIDNFVSIDLKKGNNKIVLSYYPPGLVECFCISIISLILFILSFKFKFISNNNILLNLSMYLYYVIVVIMFFIIYIYPVIRMFI